MAKRSVGEPDDGGLFAIEEITPAPARKRELGKVPPRRHGGWYFEANPQPDPGRRETIGDHVMRVRITDDDGNSLGQHTADCSCGWEQEHFNPQYSEREAWAQAFDHTGIDWRSGRVLIEPPFDPEKVAQGTGKSDPAYLKSIVDYYGDKPGPYLTLTQNCQQSKRLDPEDQVTAHNCVGIVFGRGDGEADDRPGVCMDACHSLGRLPKLCGGLQENGCREVSTHPRSFELPESWRRPEDEDPDLELCATHWAQERDLSVLAVELGQRRFTRHRPDWQDPYHLLLLQEAHSDPIRRRAGFESYDAEKIERLEGKARAAAGWPVAKSWPKPPRHQAIRRVDPATKFGERNVPPVEPEAVVASSVATERHEAPLPPPAPPSEVKVFKHDQMGWDFDL